MKKNQFAAKIVRQGERRSIEIPWDKRDDYESLVGKLIKVTIEEI